MDNNALAELLFPNITKNPEYYEEMYQSRNLKEGAMVTRFAPSPTGFVHMGSLAVAFWNQLYANQTEGIFYLRIEDTDQKREVENGVEGIINDLKNFSIIPMEGPTFGGNYGPYIQSERKEIYQTYVKNLVKKGLAYPCFCTEEELESIRTRQSANKDRLGYYGKWAVSRKLTYDEIKEKIDNNEDYVIRFKSPGNFEDKFEFKDVIKGKIKLPVNDMDIVLLKSDGIPTYHFAHVIDDHLMGTTHVIRGDEWLSSVPIHAQLFKTLGFKAPRYAHISPLTKKEGNSVRKLSKRKDPECAISFYHQLGIPNQVIKLYLATITNSNFEMWYNNNYNLKISDFKFEFSKMSVGGTYFDLDKLMNISKIYFSHEKAIDVYNNALTYYKEYDQDFYNLLVKYEKESIATLNIEKTGKRPRKDIASYSDIKTMMWYMYDELYFNRENLYGEIINPEQYNFYLLKEYIDIYNINDTKDEWYNKIKNLGIKYGYAGEVKEYKANPDNYKGHIGDVCEMIRAAVTSRLQTPDLYEIISILGKEKITTRINHFITNIKK